MLIKQLKRLILVLSAFILTNPLLAQSGLIVNEFSQGSSGEWIELVVVGDCEVDLRGWIIDDNNGIFTDCGAGNNIEHGTFSGHGVAAGHIKFSNNATWSAVKAGTIIVVYANNAFTGTLPTGELASVGDPTDANCDLLRWCPINSANSAYFDQNSMSPTSGGSTGCDCTTNNAPQGNFSYAAGGTPVNNGSWASVGLRNDGDGIQVRQPDASFFHGFSYGSPGGSCGTTFGGGPDGIHFGTSGASITYQFRNTTSDDYSVLANFQALTAGSNQSPGEANTCANATWINSMRYPVEDFFYPSCASAVESYDICQGQTATVGIPFTTCINSTWTLGTVSGSPITAFPVPGSLDPINGTIDVTGLLPGSITITLIATQDNSSLFSGCPNLEQTSEVGITINVGPGPNATPAFITACEESGGGATINLTDQDPIVGGGLQVDWFSDAGANNPISNPTAYSAPTGGSSVWAVVVDGLCVSDPALVTIAVTAAPDAFTASIVDCASPGSSQDIVDLTTLENTITGGTPANNVTFYTDAGATIPINTPGGFTVNVGTLTTVFAVVDDGSCSSAPVPIIINISATPDLVLTVTPTICEGDQVDLNNLVTETTGNGAVLIFYEGTSCSGPPISSIQTPTTAGPNFYCVEGLIGACSDNQLVTVIVTPGGDPVLQSAVVCDSDPLFDLTQLEDPFFLGGTWSGTGVTGTDFDPSNQNGIITLTYTPTNCGNAATTTIEVTQAGTPNLSTATLCSTDAELNLTTLTDPNFPSGTWSGNYVTGDNFDPSQATSNETVTLTFTPSASCASTTTTTVDIILSETPVLGTTSLCETDAVIDLVSLEDTNYPGGTWSGPGVSGNQFDPTNQSGDITLTYSPTASGQCVLDATTIVTVNTVETPTLLTASTCLTTSNFDLNTLEDTNFPGGTWSGPGVTGSIFDATGQTGTITLDYVANESCTALTSTTITVIDAPTAATVTETCNAANTEYTVTIEISGGDNTSYTINGTPVGGNVFISTPIPTGTSYSFVLDDINNCEPETISGSFTCNCDTDAGSIDFSTALTVCDSTAIDITSFYNNDFFNDGDDTLNFVIHDAADASLGNVIATSSTGVFNFPTGIPLNTVVYISPIAGNDNGSGLVDINNDPCLSIAQGIPVTIVSPDVTFSVNSPICEESCIPVTISIGNSDISISNPLTINYTLNDGSNDQFGSIILESDTTVTVDICETETLNPGLVDLSFTDAAIGGCSINYGSEQTTTVEILAHGIENITDTLCSNASITVLGAVFDIDQPSGELKLGGQAFNGCDSIININLSFFDPDTTFLNNTLCLGGEIVSNGNIYNETNPSGIETIVGGNINGCDSIIIIDLSFLSEVVFTLDSTICSGESIIVNGNTYDENNTTGSETFTNGSVLGCDSIVDINLTVINDISTIIDDTLCFGGSMLVNNVTYDASMPTGTEIMTGFEGCDSIINVDISFYQLDTNFINQTLCEDESLEVNNNIYDINNQTGFEIIPNGNAQGCDSLIEVTLTFLSNDTTDIISTLCPGESILVNNVIYDQANPTGQEIMANNAGCDSIINVNLNFHPSNIGTEILEICSNGSVLYNGTLYDINNPSGTEILIGQGAFGCDSTVNVTTNILSDGLNTIQQELCSYEFLEINGITYDVNNPTGTETLSNASFNGCDSIITIDLSFFPPAESFQTFQLCADESVIINGITYDINNTNGVEILLGASFEGCDSTVNVEIIPLPDPILDITETLCEDEFIIVNGITYDINNPTGQEILTDASLEGCDSIVNINLDFFPPAEGTVDLELPANGSITVNNVTYDINNPTGTEILVDASFEGCDSIVNISLSFIPELNSIYTVTSPACEGDSNASINIENIENAALPIQVILVGSGGIQNYEISAYPYLIENLSAGDYSLTYTDINGMILSEVVTIIDPSPYFINAGGPYEVELGGFEVISITPNFNLDSIIWTPSLYLNCDTCHTVTVSPDEAITYEVIAVNDLGCRTSTSVFVDVFNNREVFIPNVFTPDFDGINDVFTVYAGSSVRNIETLQVFDRWGNLVYEANNLEPQNLGVGWDGRYRGEIVNPDVYVYYTIIEYLDGEREIFKGDVTVIR